MHTIAIITDHGMYDTLSIIHHRLFNYIHSIAWCLGALWLLVMTVMVYGYSGLLISCLTVPTWTKPIETLDDVAASSEVILYIPLDAMGGFSKAVLASLFRYTK